MKQIMKLNFKFAVTAASAAFQMCKRCAFAPLLGIGLLAFSQSVPTYTTLPAAGTTLARVNFPTSPMQQIRIVSAVATSDLVGSVLSFYTGGTPQTISQTNVAATAVITVANTNGLAASQVLFIEGKNGITNLTISSIAYTNVTLAYNVGFIGLPGDQVYVMSAATTLPVGATTANYQGEALFVGNRGRPVSITCNATSAVSFIASARYE